MRRVMVMMAVAVTLGWSEMVTLQYQPQVSEPCKVDAKGALAAGGRLKNGSNGCFYIMERFYDHCGIVGVENVTYAEYYSDKQQYIFEMRPEAGKAAKVAFDCFVWENQ